MKKIFCQCYQNYLRHLWLKFFIFQMSGRWFPWHPKGGCTPPINLEVFFSDILATATRLNTLYGLETWYVQSTKVQTTRSVTPSRRIHALYYEDTRFQVFSARNIFLVTRYWLHGNARINFKFTRKEIRARKSRGNPRKEILAWKSVRASKSLQWNPCNNPYSQNSLILTRF